MTLYLEGPKNVFSLWSGSTINNILYPQVIEHLWTPDDLKGVGLFVPSPAISTPTGKMITSTIVQRVNGIPTYVNTYQDLPTEVPVSLPPTITACALNIIVLDDEVQEINGSYRIAAVFLTDVGQFMVIFSESILGDQPFVVPNNGVNVSISEWGDQYALIEVRDKDGGELITPSSFGFSLYNF